MVVEAPRTSLAEAGERQVSHRSVGRATARSVERTTNVVDGLVDSTVKAVDM